MQLQIIYKNERKPSVLFICQNSRLKHILEKKRWGGGEEGGKSTAGYIKDVINYYVYLREHLQQYLHSFMHSTGLSANQFCVVFFFFYNF